MCESQAAIFILPELSLMLQRQQTPTRRHILIILNDKTFSSKKSDFLKVAFYTAKWKDFRKRDENLSSLLSSLL